MLYSKKRKRNHMSVYALWNNKGGVGKSYLTFQIASEYARTHPHQKVLVLDLCPQANASSMLLGGMLDGERAIERLSATRPANTISGYIAERISSPYMSPRSGANFLTQVSADNNYVSNNLFLVCGDEELEMQSAQVLLACRAGPADAWRIVHGWIRDLIEDVKTSWGQEDITVFIDCNPSFSIYTELAMSAADRLIIPFSADGSSKRAVKSVMSLVYGIQRRPGQAVSDFFINADKHHMSLPLIYAYVGNRLTQMNNSSASAFRNVVTEIFDEVYSVWQSQPHRFCPHPTGSPAPTSKRGFKLMFEEQINDANTASVVSGAMGIPINRLTAGQKNFSGRSVTVNQSQLDKQQPNIRSFVAKIE